MAYCIQCGEELHEHARFCFYCGASVPGDHAVTPVTEEKPGQTCVPKPEKKKNTAQIIRVIVLSLVAALLIGVTVFSVSYLAGNRKIDAKNHAKEELEEAWKEFDENMELVSITYDSVNVDLWDEDEIQAYIDKNGDISLTDIDGVKYDSHWDYWEGKDYDPHTDTYRIYTVRGTYHVTDHRKQDYEGWYCITILHIMEENIWQAWETEMELPEELKQLISD